MTTTTAQLDLRGAPPDSAPDWVREQLPADLAEALSALPARTQQVAYAATLGGVGPHPSELAALFGVTDRTIRRDLEAIRAAVAGVLGERVPDAPPVRPDSSWLATVTLGEVDVGFTGGWEDRDTMYTARRSFDVSRRWTEQHCPGETVEPLRCTGNAPNQYGPGSEELAEAKSQARYCGGRSHVADTVATGKRQAPARHV